MNETKNLPLIEQALDELTHVELSIKYMLMKRSKTTNPIEVLSTQALDLQNEERNIVHSELSTQKTTGNGNCLCHAVAISCIGAQDANQRLRHALSDFFQNNQEKLKEFWISQNKKEQMSQS